MIQLRPRSTERGACPPPGRSSFPFLAHSFVSPFFPSQYTDSQVNKLEITPDKQFLAAAGAPLFDPGPRPAARLPRACPFLSRAPPPLFPPFSPLSCPLPAGNPHIRLYEVNSNNPQARS